VADLLPESTRPSELPAAQALYSRSSQPVVGVSFLPLGALDPLVWGTSHETDELVSRACEQLKLDFAFVPSWEEWAPRLSRRLGMLGVAAFWVVDGPFSRVVADVGWSDALRLTAVKPLELLEPLDEAVEATLRELRRGRSSKAGAIVVAEDLAGADGPLISPDFVNDALVPRLERIAGEAADLGLPSVIHSDGDVRAYLGAFARAGFAGVHVGGLGESAFVRILRDARVHGLRTVGGIEGEALRAGIPASVRAGTQASLFAVAGDLLIADDGSITTPEEFAAFAAAVAAARGDVD